MDEQILRNSITAEKNTFNWESYGIIIGPNIFKIGGTCLKETKITLDQKNSSI